MDEKLNEEQQECAESGNLNAFLSDIPLHLNVAYAKWKKQVVKDESGLLGKGLFESSMSICSSNSRNRDTGPLQLDKPNNHSPVSLQKDVSVHCSLRSLRRRSTSFQKVLTINNVPYSSLFKKRILLINQRHSPCTVFSVLKYEKDDSAASKEKKIIVASVDTMQAGSKETFAQRSTVIIKQQLSSFTKKGQKMSYHQYLSPTPPTIINSHCDLNSQEWTTGKHRTVMSFPSYEVSIINYIRQEELKKILNQQFRERFPQIGISLSKIRSLERKMVKTAKLYHLESGVLSKASTYFERLVFTSYIHKANRRHVAADCLLLSAKVHGDLDIAILARLIESIVEIFNVSRHLLIQEEFAVFSALHFSLIPG